MVEYIYDLWLELSDGAWGGIDGLWAGRWL
jgi:hypothetical protein